LEDWPFWEILFFLEPMFLETLLEGVLAFFPTPFFFGILRFRKGAPFFSLFEPLASPGLLSPFFFGIFSYILAPLGNGPVRNFFPKQGGGVSTPFFLEERFWRVLPLEFFGPSLFIFFLVGAPIFPWVLERRSPPH